MENAQPEPSMEEILASIRRIISEDEEEDTGAAAAKTADPVLKQPVAEPMPKAAPEEATISVIEEPTDSDSAKPHLETEDIEMLKKSATATAIEEVEGVILDKDTEDAASKAFQSLSQSCLLYTSPSPRDS